ncbi:MAG: clan AA aspartic protease [Pirellulaceae bacterium]|nr:clan AA aspartic protease [Pirellulaceae bacterium]
MIHGKVNSGLEPRINLAVHDASGGKQSIEATLDTGFNGFMTLPGSSILSLGLTKSGSTRIILGDGRVEKCSVYRAVVDWDGIPVDIEVEAADFKPLVGTGLMRGFHLHVEVERGGEVVIEPLNPRP